MIFLFNFFLFCVGVVIGSFINVVSLRYQPEKKLFSRETIGGRSHCPYCHKELKWFELIPIFSFLWQKGKCNYCGRLLFWQYPIVEFLSGLIFVLVPAKIINFQFPISNFHFQLIVSLQWLPVIIGWLLIFEIFLLIAIIDFRQYIIPDQLNLSIGLLGFLLLSLRQFTLNLSIDGQRANSFLGYYGSIINPFENIWLNHLFAAIAVMFFFGAIIILTRGRGMGWGDFKLAGALGLLFGWPDILIIVSLAFVIGSLVSVFLMLNKKKTIKDVMPFGPFLIIGSAVVFFFGFQLINLYFNLFLS